MRIGLDTENDFLLWKFQEKITIQEAILLMCGVLPEGANSDYLSSKHQQNWPKGVLPLVRLLTEAIKAEKLAGNIVYYDNFDDSRVDLSNSTVDVASLTKLIKSINFADNFFNDTAKPKAEYLDSTHPCYAPKLAAAVLAWEATALTEVQDKGTPKKQIEKWLRLNAGRFGLTRDDGNFNEKGIEEIATVANWKPQGGAAPTPLAQVETKPVKEEIAIQIPKIDLTSPPQSKSKNLIDNPPFDEEIPF